MSMVQFFYNNAIIVFVSKDFQSIQHKSFQTEIYRKASRKDKNKISCEAETKKIGPKKVRESVVYIYYLKWLKVIDLRHLR